MKTLKHYASFLACTLLTLSLSSSSLAQTKDEIDKAGTVVSVDASANKMSVRLDDEPAVRIYNISDDTDISIRGRSGQLRELRSGDRVLLNFSEAEDAERTRYALRVGQWETPADKRAEVLDVDTSENELRVRFVGGTETETYAIDPDTDIWVDGRAAELRDVREGDEVILDFEQRANNRRVIRWLTYDLLPTPQTVATNTQPSSTRPTTTRPSTLSRLPSTASALPLMGLTGALLIGFAGLIRMSRKES